MNPSNLINILEEQGISLAEVSRKTGVPKSTLSAWLRGASPNLEQLDKVAQFLHTNIDFLAFNRRENRAEDLLLYRTIVEKGSYEILIKKLPNSPNFPLE